MVLLGTFATRVCRAFSAGFGTTLHARKGTQAVFLSSSSSSATTEASPPTVPPKNIAIVGGGLAGLSTAFHLLEQANDLSKSTGQKMTITVLDKAAKAGMGGASAVAGGLVHPLSPRGKLVHWGREGLEATNYLVEHACAAAERDKTIVLRSEIFRLATSAKQADQLQQTARNLTEFCEWKPLAELPVSSLVDGDAVCGGLRLHNGCMVLHLPSYLEGLWAACQAWQVGNPYFKVQWQQTELHQLQTSPQALLSKYDAVVWAAGAGLFESADVSNWLFASSLQDESKLAVQLVRGQSVEVRLPSSTEETTKIGVPPHQALSSGKYLSPLPDPDCVLVGATHEFLPEPLSHDEVKEELQERTQSFCPHVWGRGAVVERVTEGTRVQSQRGSRGRLPIIGKLATRLPSQDSADHWIFTGLSSRGLLYHGVYGKMLAKAVLEGSEQSLEIGFDWWRRKK